MLRLITGCKEGSQFGVSLSFPALVGQTWLTLVQLSAGVCNPALCGAVWQRAQDPLKCLEHLMKSGLRSESLRALEAFLSFSWLNLASGPPQALSLYS